MAWVVVPQVVDIEQSVLLLELDPPSAKRDVQLARQRLDKQWHPDVKHQFQRTVGLGFADSFERISRRPVS